jgi:hypothetical protein
MASQIITGYDRPDAHPIPASDRFGGWCAILAAIGGLLYAFAFVVISRSDPLLGGRLSAMFLALNGLLAAGVMATLYERLRATYTTAALWALLLGGAGALGATIHGGYDLANAINPPASLNADLPNAVDPRGLLTFGVSGLALLVFAWLMRRDQRSPKGLVYLGFLLAALLVFIYLARLVVLTPASPILLIPVLLAGFVVNPAWYLWLGIVLLRDRRRS